MSSEGVLTGSLAQSIDDVITMEELDAIVWDDRQGVAVVEASTIESENYICREKIIPYYTILSTRHRSSRRKGRPC